MMIRILITCLSFCLAIFATAQPDTIVIGMGGMSGTTVSTSHNGGGGDGNSTLNLDGYLPNENSAARFLTQATLGYTYEDIVAVTETGLADWITDQVAKPINYTMLQKVEEYRQFVLAETSDPNTSGRYWRYAWWQYHMQNDDLLRQRIALALSELLVVSDQSSFGNNGHALASYYDILLTNAFGNYRDILQQITYSPTMGVYLTLTNNAKTDTSQNRFPDENYAREIMQLFTIGTTMLNMDGSIIVDGQGVPVPAYDNNDIGEFAKVFTGLTWWNRINFGRNALDLDSWLQDLVMWEDYHDPGEKYLLNGFVVPDRDPVDGNADITDALDNVFNHANTPPYVCKFLLQRLVTANPSPAFVERIANVFADNGQGVRGDLKAVVTAILLDDEAKSCEFAEVNTYGSLKEPFIRYMQVNRAFDVSTLSGNFRNDMQTVLNYTSQRPLSSTTVFNFFQQDYQPIGPIEDEGLVAPVFQITDAQKITGYINGLYRWVFSENIQDEFDLYGGEENDTYDDELADLDLTDEILQASDGQLHVLLDQLNLVLAGGKLSEHTISVIKNMVTKMPDDDEDDKMDRVKIAIYLVMSAPEYLINR